MYLGESNTYSITLSIIKKKKKEVLRGRLFIIGMCIYTDQRKIACKINCNILDYIMRMIIDLGANDVRWHQYKVVIALVRGMLLFKLYSSSYKHTD